MAERAGVVDLAVALPDTTVTVEQMHRASGVSPAEIREITLCDEFPVLGEHETAWELAVAAADEILGRAGVEPSEIGQVVCCGCGHWDQPGWSPAARIADEIGADRAHCFEITNFCNALSVGMQVAVDTVGAGRARYSLLVTADRFAAMADRGDPDSKGLFNFGDAPAAVLVGTERVGFTHLHASLRSAPDWSDHITGEYTADGVVLRRRGRRTGLGELYTSVYAELVDETLAALGRDLEDVRFLLVNHNDRRVHQRLLDKLGLDEARSVLNYGRYGHMGAADTVLGLRTVLDGGLLSPGDLLLTATSGLGFSWSVTAWRFEGGPHPR